MRAAKMKERPTFQLMCQTDVQSIYHMQMPRWLFSDPRYCEMSLDAKVTYTFLLNRFQLSRKNGWVNDRGEVFVIFPRKALAKELGLYDWICSLPDGIDSEILENAKNLSGGQQQMLCNMRALLSRAPVLILDEPAGALDKHRQALLEHVLDRMKHEKILLLSSHRMDMIEHCDCVIAMQ